jgi:hypothetical protein
MSVGSEDADGVWMTKAELAAARRISVASADRLARRMKWRKQPGNDGRARVLVPTDWASVRSESESPAPTDKPKDSPAGNPTDIYSITRAFERALDVVREQMEAERQRANRAEEAHDTALADLARAEERLRQLEIDRLVAAAAARSSLFGWLRRRNR